MNLKEWLFKERLGITDFALMLEVDRSYIHHWISGRKIPSEKIMKKIRKVTHESIKNCDELKDPDARVENKKRYIRTCTRSRKTVNVSI